MNAQCGRLLRDRGARDNLPIRRLQQLGEFNPVDIASIESQRHPSSVAMVRRWDKTTILMEGLDLEWVGEKVQRST